MIVWNLHYNLSGIKFVDKYRTMFARKLQVGLHIFQKFILNDGEKKHSYDFLWISKQPF